MLPPILENPPGIVIQAESPASAVLSHLNALEVDRKAGEARKAQEAAEAAEKARMEAVWAAHPAGNDYQPYQCTWHIAKWTKVPSGLRSAKFWYKNAEKWGFSVGSEARVGAVGVSERGRWGHVVYILEVLDNGEVLIKEGNYNYRGSVRTRTAKAKDYKYVYFN